MPHPPRDAQDADPDRLDPDGGWHPEGPAESRFIPPHGDVWPDGRHAHPRPSRLARWVVWGGTGLAAVALTAGAVIAVRHLADRALAPTPRPHPKPRRDEGRAAFDPPVDSAVPTHRAARPQRDLMQEIEANTTALTGSLDDVIRSVTAAAAGFRSVAADTRAIISEFGDAADLVHSFVGRSSAPSSGSDVPHRPFHAAPKDPSTAWHADRTPEEFDSIHDEPNDHDPRTHRL